MKGTIKSGIPKKISYIISLFIIKDDKEYPIDRYEFLQEISYDVWEEEYHVKLDNDISQTFNNDDEAFSALCTLNGIRLSIPEQFKVHNLFFIVVAAKSEPFSSKEKEALRNWVSTDRGKGISFQGLLDFFLEKGIKTTEKKILIKSPLYKSK